MSHDVPLTKLAIDSLPDPEPHSPPAGDWTDDDGQAIDSYFQAADLGPIVRQLVQAMGDYSNQPKAGSRILRARYVLASPNQGGPAQAVNALPADPNRTYLRITDLNNNGVYLHSESFTVTDTATVGIAQTAAFFVPGTGANATPTFVELYNYTGPLWVNSRFDGPAIIEILAMTS